MRPQLTIGLLPCLPQNLKNCHNLCIRKKKSSMVFCGTVFQLKKWSKCLNRRCALKNLFDLQINSAFVGDGAWSFACKYWCILLVNNSMLYLAIGEWKGHFKSFDPFYMLFLGLYPMKLPCNMFSSISSLFELFI